MKDKMDRNREGRRGTTPATVNGLSRRRQRSSSFRDSPEDEVAVELQETSRLRDRGGRKERDLDRDRDRLSRTKRRRGERLQQGSNREEGGEGSTEESLDDEEEEEDEDAPAIAAQLQEIDPAASAPLTQNHQQRKSFPTRVVRPTMPWKVPDEMMGVSVPRKARSASVKRSHECWISGGGGGGSTGGEPILRQASTSPARPSAGCQLPAMPISPSSSNASARKKMKPTAAKNRHPKVSKTASNQESEIEIEIAEVLYRMNRQFQCLSKQEMTPRGSQKLNSRNSTGSSIDTKSRGSSPVAISPQISIAHSSVLQQNSVPAPKGKRPPSVKSEEESRADSAIPDASVSSAAKIEADKPAEVEVSSSEQDKVLVPAAENDCVSMELGPSQVVSVPPEPPRGSCKTEVKPVTELIPVVADRDPQDGIESTEELHASPCAQRGPGLEDAKTIKPEPASSITECLREERFQIDLMASPTGKSSPERDDVADLEKHLASESELVPNEKIVKAEEEKAELTLEEGDAGMTEKTGTIAKELELEKRMVKQRTPDLQFNLEKLEKGGNKNELQVQKQPAQGTRNEFKAGEAVHAPFLPLPVTAGWPGGLPTRYMSQIPPPQPAVVKVDSSMTSVQQPKFLLQPRPKRCATHYYIAQTINDLRQFARPNPCWPSAAGCASLSGTSACNLNVVPPSRSATPGNPLQGSLLVKDSGSVQDKGLGATSLGHAMKDEKSPAEILDTARRKQLMQQQASQPASSNNLLAPAFLFPHNQQQSAPLTRSDTSKSDTTTGKALSSSSVSDPVGSAAGSWSASATAVSFNYANVNTNEARYVAMLQGNGYPFSMPAHVGLLPPYGGTHHPAMPLFSGSFYSPQILHSSQLQQQQQSHSMAVQPAKQNTSTSSGSSSSQKHQQQQQGGIGNTGGGTSHGFPTLNQCKQQQQNYLLSHHSQRLESDMGNVNKPSTGDSRVSHAKKSVLSHNFTMPSSPQNFTIMTPAALGIGNQGKKQQQSLKGGVELNHSQAVGMSFATFNGATAPPSGLDFSSIAQNHAVFQSLPESTRHWYQIAASPASSQTAHLKNYQIFEEGKSFGNSTNSSASHEDERKMARKDPATISKSLTFSRPEKDPSNSTILGNSPVESSRNSNHMPLSGSCGQPLWSAVPPATTSVISNSQQHHHYQQQLIQLQQQQHQELGACTKSGLSNANTDSERITSAISKFSNAVSILPQSLAQSSSVTQSAQWKTSEKAGTAAISSCQAPAQSAKCFLQQQNRNQLCVAGQTQISFGVSTKLPTSGQHFSSNKPFPSTSSGVVPPSTSMSKSVDGSPTNSRAGPNMMLSSSQPAKNMPFSSGSKSSPVGIRHMPSIVSNSNVSPAESSTVKPQQPLLQNQQQQQLLQKHFQQAQPIFCNGYMQTQPLQPTASTASGYHQKQQSEEKQLQHSSAVSSGMLSLCSPSVPLSGPATSDPTKAIANLKGLPPPQGFFQAAQFSTPSAGNPHLFMSTAIPYIHSVPAVPLKSADQKPAAGK